MSRLMHDGFTSPVQSVRHWAKVLPLALTVALCQSAVGYPETEVPFYPARLGTYRIIATVDEGGDKTLCEVEVVAQQ